MASPIGHAAVGVAVASVAGKITGTPSTVILWIGAVVASGIPDLDVLFPLMGFSKRFHRSASHSLFIITVEILAGWLLARALMPGLSSGVLLAWSAALVSHPLLDVITTGPATLKDGDKIKIKE